MKNRKVIIGSGLFLFAVLCELAELGGAWLLGINIQGMNYLEYMTQFYSVPWHVIVMLVLYIATGWYFTNKIDKAICILRRKIAMEYED